MSSTLKPALDQRIPWLSGLLVLVSLSLGSVALTRVLDLSVIPPQDAWQPAVESIAWEAALADSLAGRAVIVDLRPAPARQARPVPGGAVALPPDPGHPAWQTHHDLLVSLEATSLYLLVPPGAWRQAHEAWFHLRRRGHTLRHIEGGP